MAETALSKDEIRSSKIKSDLEEALKKKNVTTASFPADIETMDYWVCFRVNKSEFSRKNDYKITNDKARIFLPVPLSFGTEYNHSYNNSDLGLAGMAGAATGGDLVKAITGNTGSITDLISRVGSLTAKDIGGAVVYYGAQAAEENLGGLIGGALGGGITSAIAGAAAGQFLKGAIAGAGLARNPYMAVMYSHPEFRNHTFSWKLIAKSREETESIKQIIHLFKYHAAPGIAAINPHFFDYPEQFDIDLHYDKYLFNIAPSVLTSINVSYHAEGYPAYHNIESGQLDLLEENNRISEKAPVSITLSISLREISIVSKNSITMQNR